MHFGFNYNLLLVFASNGISSIAHQAMQLQLMPFHDARSVLITLTSCKPLLHELIYALN
jgi:hypothetical protein